MKEATGELNMTVITIVAIAAIAAFFYAFVWPSIQKSISVNQCEAACGDLKTKDEIRAAYSKENPEWCPC